MEKVETLSRTRFYLIFKGLRNRCNNSNNQAFKLYGGKGVECKWRNFESFREDMFASYCQHVQDFGEKDTTIERIKNNGNYCKENCRWATRSEQGKNTTRITKLIFRGETKSMAEWARVYNVSYKSLANRLYSGWSLDKALTVPYEKPLSKNQKSILHREWARKNVEYLRSYTNQQRMLASL